MAKSGKTIIRVKSKGHKPCIPIPPLEDLQDLAKKTLGNKTKMAEAIGVSRCTFDKWCREHEEVAEAVKHQRGKRLDGYLDVAHNIAMGIPDIDKDTGRQVGWVVPPDSAMLRFMIEKYGSMEGFGQELNVNANVSVIGSVSIERWLKLNGEKE